MEINTLVLSKEPTYSPEHITEHQKDFVSLLHHENKIKEMLNEIQTRFLQIAYRLIEIEESGVYHVCYDDSGEYCKDVYRYAYLAFGFSKTTTFNLVRIARSFSDEFRGLKKQYVGYGLSQLTELLSIPEPLHKYFTPEMTVKDMRELKNGQKLFCTHGVWHDKKCISLEIPTSELENNNQNNSFVPTSELENNNSNNLLVPTSECKQKTVDVLENELEFCNGAENATVKPTAAPKTAQPAELVWASKDEERLFNSFVNNIRFWVDVDYDTARKMFFESLISSEVINAMRDYVLSKIVKAESQKEVTQAEPEQEPEPESDDDDIDYIEESVKTVGEWPCAKCSADNQDCEHCTAIEIYHGRAV